MKIRYDNGTADTQVCGKYSHAGYVYDSTAGICAICLEKNEKGKCTKAIPEMRKCFQTVPANCDALTARLERI